jgi:hypothetical protein
MCIIISSTYIKEIGSKTVAKSDAGIILKRFLDTCSLKKGFKIMPVLGCKDFVRGL